MMTNRRDGVLYIGVTSNLPKRAHEHREGFIEGFTKQYGQRERTMKHWPRAWKVRLVHAMNPEWDDLYDLLI